MKAVRQTRYGSPDVLEIVETGIPTLKDNDILIRNHASPVSAADGMMRRGIPRFGRLFLGLFGPKHSIPGTGFAGIVENVGKNVSQFKTGDRVFGESVDTFGAHAEYVVIPADGVVCAMPDNLSFAEAAPVCDGALTSYNFLTKVAESRPDTKVLINGASGGLGTAAVSIAALLGAEVTGVCSAANHDLVKSLGADHVIDYNAEDFTRSGKSWDIIYDTVGKSSYRESRAVLTDKGAYISPVLGIPLLMQVLLGLITGRKRARFSATGFLPVTELMPMLNEIKTHLATGKIRTVIEREFPLEEIAEAHRHVDTGHKKGNIVVSMHGQSVV